MITEIIRGKHRLKKGGKRTAMMKMKERWFIFITSNRTIHSLVLSSSIIVSLLSLGKRIDSGRMTVYRFGRL